MDEFLIPTAKNYLIKYINSLARRNDHDAPTEGRYEFTKEDAILDLQLAINSGTIKPYRYYSKRWHWKEGTTYSRWNSLVNEAEKRLNFGVQKRS